MGSRVAFHDLPSADLVVDAVYEGGTVGNVSDDPIARLLPVGNQGGFRFSRRRGGLGYSLAVLYTSGLEPDWPDRLDVNSGFFVYYGDNKSPGSGLHETTRGGNKLLRAAFEEIHRPHARRSLLPPFFVFRKEGHAGRNVRFLGVAVPGAVDTAPSDDLVAVWRTKNGDRFQNYRAAFTILDIGLASRGWIQKLLEGDGESLQAPRAYREWIETGRYLPLQSPSSLPYRTTSEQKPQNERDMSVLTTVYDHFKPDPWLFEALAIDLWKMAAREEVAVEATRRTADAGRDAFGTMLVGPPGGRIPLKFSLEAKCFEPSRGCGVSATSRLISRLRNRDFGVFVTTSFVGPAPSKEIFEDQQPIVVIAGRDIVDLLRDRGLSSARQVSDWLQMNYQHGASRT